MRHRQLPWMVVLACIMVATAFAQQVRRPTVTRRTSPVTRAAKDKPLLSPAQDAANMAVSPVAVQKAKTPATRAQGVAALMANAKTKSTLDKVAQSAGLASAQLATKSVSGKAIPAGALVTTLPETAVQLPTLEELDWETGVHFSPWGCPRIQEGGNAQKVGVYPDLSGMYGTGAYGPREMYEDGVVTLDWDSGFAELWGRLPAGAGTYVLTVKLAPADGTSLTQWLETRGPDECLLLYVGHGGGWATPDPAPLADGSGFALVVTMTPAQESVGSYYDVDMQTVDWVLEVASGTSGSFGKSLLFGGVTVSRL